jgi:hypothetical protein
MVGFVNVKTDYRARATTDVGPDHDHRYRSARRRRDAEPARTVPDAGQRSVAATRAIGRLNSISAIAAASIRRL